MNTIPTKKFIALLVVCLNFSCQKNQPHSTTNIVGDNLNSSIEQVDLQIKSALVNDRIPRTQNEDGSIRFTSNSGFDWTEGFFPGICWNAYSITNDEKQKEAAQYFQAKVKEHRYLTTNHDLGFVFNCSYGIGYRLTKNEEYKQVLIDAGNSLIQRYNPVVGCIQSWNVDSGWQSARGWDFPVIIDNMMNLELLFELTEITGDPKYKNIAISHANTTLKNHFRADNSSYHVVDYDKETGEVRSKETAQGYAHESAWARGQAWGLYGYTVSYRYTMDSTYLDAAEHIASFILTNPKLPGDKVPYWDYNAPQIPNEPRDVSAAAITASALVELNNYSDQDYLKPAEEIIENLSSEKYKAKIGTNNNFLLKNSVGSIPHNAEIDVPLIYADYYYLESLIRLQEPNILYSKN